jgi:hypothetical protein
MNFNFFEIIFCAHFIFTREETFAMFLFTFLELISGDFRKNIQNILLTAIFIWTFLTDKNGR